MSKKLLSLLASKKVDKTVLDIIDNNLLKKRKKFDQEELKAAAIQFAKIVNQEDFNMDAVMVSYFRVFKALYAEQPRGRGVFHPSSILSDCERRLYFEFIGEEPSNYVARKIEPSLQRIFDVGTWWHTYIQSILYEEGVLIASEVPIVSRRRKLGGRADGVLRITVGKLLLEIKSINTFQFGKVTFAPLQKHEVQAGIYARHLGIEKICYLYINKDTGAIKEHIKPILKSQVDAAYDKMNFVLESVKTKDIPKRTVCKSFTDPEAKKCEYCDLCFNLDK